MSAITEKASVICSAVMVIDDGCEPQDATPGPA